jgi:hypothetical protein
MPPSLSINKIITAVLKGIELSQKKYEAWSGGWWLWAAPEYLITVNVAENIAKLAGSKYITLEESSRDAIEDAGAKGRGRLPRTIREHGRVDIVLWWASETPRAIIEIKNQIYTNAQYIKDVERIKEFLKRNSQSSTLQFGLLAFYDSADEDIHKNADEKITAHVERIYQNSTLLLGEKFKIQKFLTKIHSDEESAWAGVCFLIRHHN